MPTRFVLLRHDVPPEFGRASHWDLLLEQADACATWALDELPAGLSAESNLLVVVALRLGDHRKHYLDYEGPVSGNRGVVSQVTSGTCEWLEDSPDRVVVELAMSHTELQVQLQRIDDERWELKVE
ncbi:DNA polymerase ligase N-terminal domain-containing protein [Aeoliella mucimassa]|uniref:DNA ligase D 3'-phosphoesterase domain-containing protein n=1 Tax=Aeoliella mucimassa TaxID=2527972 RepID=A0A518ASN0_9BACT|nr:DNA polymerase ligase N-terminal domain-containing protein [Aeoliella mucimassa]QDU57721.1 hypothetical protein Pan181_39430 [Aeoliella mucimassa]